MSNKTKNSLLLISIGLLFIVFSGSENINSGANLVGVFSGLLICAVGGFKLFKSFKE